MVAIRLMRAGKKHFPFYKVVAINKSRPRDSRFIEQLGYYDPVPDKSVVKIDLEKYNQWINKGAKPSQTVKSLIKKVKTDS